MKPKRGRTRRRRAAGTGRSRSRGLESTWSSPQAPRPPSGYAGRMPSSAKNEYSVGASEIVQARTMTANPIRSTARVDVSSSPEPEPLPGLDGPGHRGSRPPGRRDLVRVVGVLVPCARARAGPGGRRSRQRRTRVTLTGVRPWAAGAPANHRRQAARGRCGRPCSSTRPTSASGSPSTRRPAGRRAGSRGPPRSGPHSARAAKTSSVCAAGSGAKTPQFWFKPVARTYGPLNASASS